MERLVPKPELLVGRSTEVAEGAEQKARELLARHPDLVAPEVVDLIVQKEGALALQEYRKRRLEGYANDDFSRQPGLTMYLRPLGLERVIDICMRGGYTTPSTQIKNVMPNLFALYLPKAVYLMGRGGAQFYLEANTGWGQSQRGEKPFALGYNDVVRIEGDANELWQNVNYRWDGTPNAP